MHRAPSELFVAARYLRQKLAKNLDRVGGGVREDDDVYRAHAEASLLAMVGGLAECRGENLRSSVT